MLFYHGELRARIRIRIFDAIDGRSSLEFDGSAKLPPGSYIVLCENCGDCTVKLMIATSHMQRTMKIASGNQARRTLVIKEGDRSIAVSFVAMPSMKIKITR